MKNLNYSCPYCNISENKRTKKKFDNWKSIRAHIGKCINNTKDYIICEYYGPIKIDSFNSTKEFWLKYPNTTIERSIFKTLRKYDKSTVSGPLKGSWNKIDCINSIKDFHKRYNRIPQRRDFSKTDLKYPNYSTVTKLFGSWNQAIIESGFQPEIQDGFGIRIEAKDGILYRSSYETKFVNEYLYNKHKYKYEIKYPDPYNKYYDFYLPEWDLYIEIDGNLRPEIMQEKIQINIKLNRNLLVINTKNWDNDINEFLKITKE